MYLSIVSSLLASVLIVGLFAAIEYLYTRSKETSKKYIYQHSTHVDERARARDYLAALPTTLTLHHISQLKAIASMGGEEGDFASMKLHSLNISVFKT